MKKTILTVLIFAVIAAVVIPFSLKGGSGNSSNKNGGAAPVVEKKNTVTFTQEITLAKERSLQLENSFPEGSDLTFKSSDENVATVDENGKIKAVNAGVAYVSAEVKNGKYDAIYNTKVFVIISDFLKTVKNKDSDVLNDGMTVPKLAKTDDVFNITVGGIDKKGEVSFSSSNDKVATVNENGEVKALKKGRADITATVTQGDNTYVLTEKLAVYDDIYDYSVTDEQRIEYYKDAAFIGNSIGVGLKAYIENNLGSKLGKPLIMVKGSYAFHNDKSSNSGYMIEYEGKEMKAKNAVKASGKKKIFINMGTNDLFNGGEVATKNYIEYVEGIKELSPDVTIFIESTTSATPGKAVKSSNVKVLNENMKKYCDEHEDFYFIDFNKYLVDGNYDLYPKYSTDNYVHLNNTAYEIWMNEVMSFTDKMMVGEQVADNAVETAEATKLSEHIEQARALVDELPKGAVKDGYNERLDKLTTTEE